MSWIERVFANISKILTWWVVITPWEQGLRVRLGKYVKLLGPGVSLRIPLVDKVYVQSFKLRTIDLGMQTVTTTDGKTLSIGGCLKYQIMNLETLYQTLLSPDATMLDLVAGKIAEFVSTHTLAQCSGETLSDYTVKELNLEQYGVGNVAVQITDLLCVRTYRIVSQDRMWRASNRLNLDPEDHHMY